MVKEPVMKHLYSIPETKSEVKRIPVKTRSCHLGVCRITQIFYIIRIAIRAFLGDFGELRAQVQRKDLVTKWVGGFGVPSGLRGISAAERAAASGGLHLSSSGVRQLISGVTIVAALLLAGCAGDLDQTVTFLKGGAWEVDLVASIPQEMAFLSGSPVSIEEELQRQMAEYEADGIQVSWEASEDESNLLYTFHFEGNSLDALEDSLFEGDVEVDVFVVGGERQIQYSQYLDQGFFGDLNSFTLTLVGDEVISSNGQKIEKGKVQWNNPSGRIEAVLTEKGQFNSNVLLTVGGVVIVALLAALVLYGRRSSSLTKGYRPTQAAVTSVDMRYCNNCGEEIPASAKFCPKCGHKRP